ncbi:hypothetical protein [Ruegeria pomeroyi]|uniref:hypothetical protein n=1 Tax=Ruegeria pomeroyi TaxID=89184 RepID=UPI001F468229|nr:hypothetical protein [Ruegeria pomeroyi]
MRQLITVLFSFLALPALAEEAHWRPLVGFDKVWTKQGATFDGPETGRFTYDALRFGREVPLYEYEFFDMEDLFNRAYGNRLAKGVLVNAATGGARILSPTMAEAWLAVRDNPAVVAVVPMGFARVAGDTRVVGYRRIDGRDMQSMFFARNLDAILCLNDMARRNADSYDGQVPFLFGLNLGENATYSYVEGLDKVNLADASNPQRFRQTFDACSDLLQLGRRVIEPRDYRRVDNSRGRITVGPAASSIIKPAERVVLLYDRFGHMNFVRTHRPTGIYELGRLLSSDGYYDNEPCKYLEKKEYRGRSLSCELWAVTIAAFDGAAIAVRQGDKAVFWGDPGRYAPGVLVIRRKAAAEPPEAPTAPAPAPAKAAPVLPLTPAPKLQQRTLPAD